MVLGLKFSTITSPYVDVFIAKVHEAEKKPSETEKAEIMSNDNLYDLSYLNEISRGDNDFLKKMIWSRRRKFEFCLL